MINIYIEKVRIYNDDDYEMTDNITLTYDNDSLLGEIKIDLENEAGIDLTTEDFLSVCNGNPISINNLDSKNSYEEINISLYEKDCASF